MKILFSIVSVLIVVLAGLLVAPSFIDWSQYKDQIKTQVEKSTGYSLDLGGAISAAILPTPHVTLENVAIDSANGNTPVAFKGQIDKLAVSVGIIPLLSGNIAINEVDLKTPIITFKEIQSQTAEQKQLAQLTEQKSTSQSSDKKATEVSLDALNITDAKITYNPLKGEATVVEFPKMVLSAKSMKGPFNYDGRVLVNAMDLAVKGKVDEMVEGKPIAMTTSIDGGAYGLSYSGIVDTTKETPELQGELSVQANSIQSLASQFGAKDIAIKDQSFALTGLVAGTTKVIRLDNGQLSLGNAKDKMPVKFNFATEAKKGAVKVQSLPGGGMIDLDIAMGDATSLKGQVDISNLKILTSDVLGVVDAKTFDNPQVPNKISGDINAVLADVMSLRSQNLLVGEYKLAGTNVRYTKGEKPKIDAKIDSFEGAKISAVGTLDMAQGVNVSVSHPNAVNFIRVFKNDFKSSPNLTKPFAFSGLVLKDGDTITAKNMTAKIGDVSTTGEFSMDNSGAVPNIAATVNFDKLDTRALITGEKSTAVKGNPTAGVSSSASKSTASPWTRDAIDTSALRSVNLNLKAKANELVHGTWLITNPVIDIDLNNGVLNINSIKGGLFGGQVDIQGRVSATAEGQPISINSKLNASDVNLSSLVKAAMSQTKERVVGTGSFNLDLSTSGLSSSALAYGLNADGKITTSDLVVKGIDLAKVTEAISDESLTDLAAVIRGAFNSGQTPFEAVNHPIAIREGTMPVNNFTLVSPTAQLISNGTVSFSNWNMDIKNTVDFTNPDDLPNVEMTIKGPLNAPQQNVASDVLRSFIMNKYGAKIQNKVDKLLGDKLRDTPAAGVINNLLGLPPKQQAPTQQPSTIENPVNDNVAPTSEETVPAPAPAPEEEPQAQPKIEEQLIKGLFDQLAQ